MNSKSKETLIVSNFTQFFDPLLNNLDANIVLLKNSQMELSHQIKILLKEIGKIYEDEKIKFDLDDYSRRLNMAKKRVNNVQATIMTVQERLNKIYVSMNKEMMLQ